MAKAIVTSRKYTNLFRPETTSYLTGNVGDVIDLALEIDVEISSLSSFSNSNKMSNGDRITRNTGSWLEDGFVEGQNIELTFDVIIPATPPAAPVITTFTFTADILTLTPTIMICENIAGSSTVLPDYVLPYIDTDYELSGLTITSTGSVEGCEIEYALVTNTQTQGATTTSLIDGTSIVFSNLDINANDPTVLNFLPKGFKSGASILSSTIKGLGIVGITQSFEVNIKYIVTPLFESVSDLETATLPSFYKDTECISDTFKIKFLPQSGNPNVSISTSSSETALLGNTGFFNENYNGKANNFSIDNYSLLNNLGIPATGIQTSNETSFTIVVSDANGTASSKYKLGYSWTPEDETLYSENSYYNMDNLMYNGLDDSAALQWTGTAQTYTGKTHPSGARMDIELTSLTNSAGLTTFKGKFKPNSLFTEYIESLPESDQKYLVWISLSNPSLATNISDRVSLIAESGTFIIADLNTQPWTVTNSFLEHAQPASQVGVSFLESCVEDEILARSVVTIDTSKDEIIEEVTFSIEGYNSVTQESFTLESNAYDTSSFVKDSNGIQQISIDKKRGFLMDPSIDKDWVKLERSPVDDSGTLAAYKFYYAFRVRWEDWIANVNVPSNPFYNNTKLNDNLNNDWAGKDDPANWNLTFNVSMKVNSLGTIINTKNRFGFTAKTYEESVVWDGEITHFNEAKTNNLFTGIDSNGIRNNVILSSSNTLIQADFDLEDVGGDVGDISAYFGVIRIEEYRNGGIFKIHMLSTILKNLESGNILIPLLTETKCKITKVSNTKIRLECLIDNGELKTSASRYKTSARIGCADLNLGKYSAKYSLKYD